jgi:putative ABC transport system permease protein
MRGLWGDVRYSARLLKREPGFALVAMLTIGLGIGLTTTWFSVAYGVLLRPLPWPDADRIMRVTESRRGQQGRLRGTIANGSFLAWRDRPSTIEELGGYGVNSNSMTVSRSAMEPVRVVVGRATPSLFHVLRATPLRGRIFNDAEAPMAGVGAYPDPQVVILSWGLWQDWFGGRDDAIGAALRIDDLPVTVIGVMPRDFRFPTPESRAWLPMPIGAVKDGKVLRLQIFGALARLAPGATPEQASSEATSRARSAPDPGMAAVAMFGSTAPSDISVTPAIAAMTADVRPAILLLFAAVGLLLVTVTANIGSLQLARATTRRREMAVRAAIGAGGTRLVRQLVTESAVLGVGSGLLGLALTVAMIAALPAILPADFPRAAEIAINLPVLGCALAVSLVVSVACALFPAAEASRVDLSAALASDSAASSGGAWRSRSGRLRTAIMALQVAVACLLLVGASLLGRSFLSLMHADRGYDPVNVLTARVDLPRRYNGPLRAAFADAAIDRLRAAPGIVTAAAGNALPMVSGGSNFGFSMPSPRDPALTLQVQTMVRHVSPEYFAAMRLRLLQGRLLSDADTQATRPVVVVNRSFAQRYLGAKPIGTRLPLGFGEGRPNCDVVGIVDDMRQGDVTDALSPEVFASYRQHPDRLAAPLILLARTVGDPMAQVPALREVVRAQDPTVALDSVMTLEERIATSLARPRIYAVLIGGLALSALVVAAVGLFGVLSYAVAQRSREIGIRTALGARAGDIVRLVLRHAVLMAAAGIVAGLATAAAAVRLLSGFLFGVTARDPLTFVAVPLLLLAAAAIACVVPARRASKVDPLIVLKSG